MKLSMEQSLEQFQNDIDQEFKLVLDKKCIICEEYCADPTKFVFKECGHGGFHRRCLKNWLNEQSKGGKVKTTKCLVCGIQIDI